MFFEDSKFLIHDTNVCYTKPDALKLIPIL